MNFLLWIFLLSGLRLLSADERIEKITLPLIPDLQRADLYVLQLTPTPAAILVLVPGVNDNGETWLENPVWQEFARDYHLNLAGVSFASDRKLLQEGRGYYYPKQGSGQLLLAGLHRVFRSDIPLLMYGFSGGAHFTSGFEEWDPKDVMGWSAYSAEWWTNPSPSSTSPPGLVLCGNEDERYGASLLYFKEGRALGKPWLWIGVPKNGHSISEKAEDFVRNYFGSLLNTHGKLSRGQWMDIDLGRKATEDTVNTQPTLTGWLPSLTLMNEWKEVHQP